MNNPKLKLENLVLVTLLALNFACGSNDSTTQSNNPTAHVATDPIADLPDYPGATRTAYTKDSTTAKAEMQTSDPLDKVLEFYNVGKLSKENGWKPVNVKSSSASADESQVAIDLSKGTSTAKVEITQKGKGNVTIVLERKDN
jgi:hypothetical protein